MTTIISENFATIVGIVGTILGVILGFVGNYVLQSQQRKWMLDDQRRERARNRKKEQLAEVQRWAKGVMIYAQRFRSYRAKEIACDESSLMQEFRKRQIEALAEYENLGAATSAITKATGDAILEELCRSLDKLLMDWPEIILARNVVKEEEMWERMGEIAGKILRRSEEILEALDCCRNI